MNRDEFFRLIQDRVHADGLRLVQRAYWFAKNEHRVQSRNNGERYFEHCRAVALILISRKIYDPSLLALALIHDVLEDTFAPPSAIVALFGSRIYSGLNLLSHKVPVTNEITGRVTDRAARDPKKYFGDLLAASTPPKLVKCADRIHNLRDYWDDPALSYAVRQEKKRRKLEETVEFVFPIAKSLDDPWYMQELGRLVIRLDPSMAERVCALSA